MPLYAPDENTRDENYIQNSVTGGSLLHLTKFVTRFTCYLYTIDLRGAHWHLIMLLEGQFLLSPLRQLLHNGRKLFFRVRLKRRGLDISKRAKC